MPFKDIACHVWAIDGYKDDATAKDVNERYVAASKDLVVSNNKASRDAGLKALVDASRRSAHTKEVAIVYGGYRRGQKTPEHMWMEYNGLIYETMPGYELHKAVASSATRKCPPLENDAFESSGVAEYKTYLTESQKAYIASVDTSSSSS